jgi:hypothetical protein
VKAFPVSATSAAITGTTRLCALELIIQRGKQTFFEVGNALAEIMEAQLYREKGFGSFAEYCETVWGFKKSYAYQLVQSSALLKELPAPVSTIVEKMSPGQVRELVKVPKSEREEVIKTAVEKAKSSRRKMTAKDIAAAAHPITTVVEAEVVADEIKTFCPKAKTKRELENWYSRASKEKRGQFFEYAFSFGQRVIVPDKERFKARFDFWFENYVAEQKKEESQ